MASQTARTWPRLMNWLEAQIRAGKQTRDDLKK
jgi:hypothetical protein